MDDWGWLIELAKIAGTGTLALVAAWFGWKWRSREAVNTHWRGERQTAYAALLATHAGRERRLCTAYDALILSFCETRYLAVDW